MDRRGNAIVSKSVREKIVSLHFESGKTVLQIATELKVDRKTVYKWLKRYLDGDESFQTKARNGRPRCTNKQQDEDIKEIICQDPIPSSGLAGLGIHKNLGCSYATVRRRLIERGIKHYVAAKKPTVTKVQRDARIQFADFYVDMPQDFWNLVIFSNEMTFKVNQEGKIELWRPSYTRNNEEDLAGNENPDPINLSFWGALSAAGPGPLVKIPSKMNSEDYVNVLRTHLFPYLETIVPEGEEVAFVQDNCPMHQANVTQCFFGDHPSISVLPWPSNSPDLNPIENVWEIITEEWNYNVEMSSGALEAHIRAVWDSLGRRSSLLENLIESMQPRLLSVIENYGDITKY